MKTLFFFISFLFVVSASAAEKSITLSLGESHRISLKGSPSIWIQDRNVVRADGAGSQLILKGQNEGRTTLRIGSDVYEIQVLHPLKTNSFDDLRIFLKGVVGLTPQIKDGELQIQGTLYRLKDWVKVAEFAKVHRLSYRMRAEIPETLREEIQEFFGERLSKAKLPPQTLILDPSPEIRIKASELSAKKYDVAFGPYGVQVIRDESSIEIAPTVKVEITVAEVKKGLSRKWGVKWPDSYEANIMPDKTIERGPLTLALVGAEESGDAKILASPNILCRSGQEAEFLAGGEFPIKVVGHKSESVMWRRYGITLKVKPKADAGGRISLSVETEVTTMDKATQVGDIPGLRINRVSSHFDLTKPQTIALSGLLKNEDGKSSSGLPWLSQLPVLGPLFSSKDFKEDRSELVIFVRPSIVNENENSNANLHHLKETI